MLLSLLNYLFRHKALWSILLGIALTCNSFTSIAQTGAQEKKIDSLITLMISLEKSPKKADVLNELSGATVDQDYDMALQYAQQSLAISEELSYDVGIIRSSLSIGRIYTFYYLDYFEAKHHMSVAVQISERLGNDGIKLKVYQDYGYLMYSMGDCNNAPVYYEKAIEIADRTNDYDRLASLYSYLADVYMDCGDKKSGIDNYAKSFALYQSDKLITVEPAVQLSAALYLRMLGKYDESKDIYQDAIDRFHRENNPRFESYAYSQLARCELLEGDYFSAKEHVNEGLRVAQENGLTKEKLDNYEVQIALYDTIGDYKKTYVSLIKYTRLKDSLNDARYTEQNMKFQTNYDEMMNRNRMEQMKEQQRTQELEIENKNLNRNIIVGLLVFVGVIAILMILRLRYIRKKEAEMKVLTLATSHTTNSIILFDEDIRVVWVNKGFERLTGLTLDEVKGEYFMDFYNGPDLDPQHVEGLKKNFLAGKAFNMELSSFNRNTKRSYWISISVTPLYEDNQLKSYVSVATDITAIHDAQEQLMVAHDQTVLMNEIGRQITSTLSISEIIEKVYENVNKLMDAQNLGIGIYREEDNELFFPEPIEKGNKLQSFHYSLDNDQRLAVKCFNGNQEICVGSIEENIRFAGTNVLPKQGEQPESIIYVPLIAKWKTMGVISVQSFKQQAYAEKELDIVRSLATYVAIAMENAQLYENMEDLVARRTKKVTEQKEQLQRNFDNIRALSEIGVDISSAINFESIFEKLYETVAMLMDAEIFGVRIYHEDINEIEYKFEIESGKRDPVMSVSMNDKDNYSVWCVENKREILLNDNMNEYQKYVNEIKVPSGEMPASLIFYPMLAEGRVFGVITVQSFKKNAYTPYHVAIIKTISSYSAAALSNQELYETLEHKVDVRTKELAQKNKDIMASINYAKRIQRGILPTKTFMDQLLPENFVFYRPRDIISGDFYWVERARGKVFFAVVDCTGHGVPGALMSIIGKNILDQAVNEKEVDDPSMILTFLRAGLRVAFSADEYADGSEVEDGMDLGVCVWDKDDRTITFSGANSNLYLVHDGALEVIKGEKAGVSASDFDMKNYTSHEVEILKGDTVYMSSDGYPDQFGGERIKKYSQRRFQELLLKLSSIPMNQQEDELDKEFREWKGEHNQLDDICVMGVKF